MVGNTSEAPYFNSLLKMYGLATSYGAVAHPSLPNYVAMTGGSTFGISDDCTDCFVSAPNIAVDRVEASGRSWKSYQESMPSPCFVADSYPYMQKHNPFIYFDNIRTRPSECARVVPFSNLATDLPSTSTTPNYAWITPDMCTDTHNCSIRTGDDWLARNVPAILNSPAFPSQKSLLVITYDEDENGANRVPAAMIAKDISPGFRSGVAYDQYSLLKTVEAAWGLAPLTPNDAQAAPMSEFFAGAPSPSPTPAPAPAPAPAPRRELRRRHGMPARGGPSPSAGGLPTTAGPATS